MKGARSQGWRCEWREGGTKVGVRRVQSKWREGGTKIGVGRVQKMVGRPFREWGIQSDVDVLAFECAGRTLKLD